MLSICLYNLRQLGLVVPINSGATYFNRVNRLAEELEDRHLEGLFVPLCNDPPSDSPELEITQRLNQIWADNTSLTIGQASAINEVLWELSTTDQYEVCRSQLQESVPGWLFVDVLPNGDFSQLQGLDPFTGVLTWPLD